jgi:hypothetical protein
MSVVEEELFDCVAVENDRTASRAEDRPPTRGADSRPAIALPAAMTARLHGFTMAEHPLLSGVPGLPMEIVPARSTCPLHYEDIGRNVLVLFEHGDARRPIVVGVLREPSSAMQGNGSPPDLVSVQRDDDRLVLTADREIVLRCGGASITLTRAGKVILRGEYVLSKSEGVNRIVGGSVQIN